MTQYKAKENFLWGVFLILLICITKARKHKTFQIQIKTRFLIKIIFNQENI